MSHHDLLPDQQHEYPGLARLTPGEAHARRERVYLILAGFFLGTLAMLNILGITRFIVLWDTGAKVGTTDIVFAVAAGVLPYPITFLCTDFISELYGRRRASRVVWVGFFLNLWVIAILWLATALPGFTPIEAETGMPPAPVWDAEKEAYIDPGGWTLFQVRNLAFGAVAASMIAYLTAQLVDVHVFHFWKRLTKSRHLWLRNNGSTLVSQLVDTTAVILITHFYAHALPIDEDGKLWLQLLLFIATGYAFKVLAALVDTLPFYFGAHWLAKYLRLPPPSQLPHPSGAAAVEAGVG